MKKLNKEQTKRRQELLGALEGAKDAFEHAVGEYNDKKNEAWAAVQEKMEELNSAITDADEFRQEIQDEMDGYYSERSEKWQEGDTGVAYEAFMEEWSNELEQIELDDPEDVEVPDVDALETFDNMPTEFEGA